MGFAVYHSAKGSGSGGGLGSHIDRVEGKEKSYPHADPDRINDNQYFKVNDYCKMSFTKAVNERIKDGYKGKTAIRKDAVKYITHILTGSHDEMIEIFKDKKKANEWIKANYNFISERFGKENIVRFTLHLDERTPHIHCVTVPLTDDGRLSAKELVGNNKKLEQTQDLYAKYMQPLGLQRGRKKIGVKHRDVREYYKDIAEELKQRKNKIDGLDSQISELKAELSGLKTKDVLVNIFQPKKKLKEKSSEINELLQKLAGLEAKRAEQSERLLNTSLKLQELTGQTKELFKENAKLKQTPKIILDQVNKLVSGSNLKFIIENGSVTIKQTNQDNKRSKGMSM